MANGGAIARAGALRHVVTIEKRTTARDAYGDVSQTWTTHATVRGSVETLRHDELVHAGQVEGRRMRKVRIRYVSGIETTMRLKVRGETYHIRGLSNIDERDRVIEILAEEVTD